MFSKQHLTIGKTNRQFLLFKFTQIPIVLLCCWSWKQKQMEDPISFHWRTHDDCWCSFFLSVRFMAFRLDQLLLLFHDSVCNIWSQQRSVKKAHGQKDKNDFSPRHVYLVSWWKLYIIDSFFKLIFLNFCSKWKHRSTILSYVYRSSWSETARTIKQSLCKTAVSLVASRGP